MRIGLGRGGLDVHKERVLGGERFFSETLLDCCFPVCWGLFNCLPSLNVSLTAMQLPATVCRTSETTERSLSSGMPKRIALFLQS